VRWELKCEIVYWDFIEEGIRSERYIIIYKRSSITASAQ